MRGFYCVASSELRISASSLRTPRSRTSMYAPFVAYALSLICSFIEIETCRIVNLLLTFRVK